MCKANVSDQDNICGRCIIYFRSFFREKEKYSEESVTHKWVTFHVTLDRSGEKWAEMHFCFAKSSGSNHIFNNFSHDSFQKKKDIIEKRLSKGVQIKNRCVLFLPIVPAIYKVRSTRTGEALKHLGYTSILNVKLWLYFKCQIVLFFLNGCCRCIFMIIISLSTFVYFFIKIRIENAL